MSDINIHNNAQNQNQAASAQFGIGVPLGNIEAGSSQLIEILNLLTTDEENESGTVSFINDEGIEETLTLHRMTNPETGELEIVGINSTQTELEEIARQLANGGGTTDSGVQIQSYRDELNNRIEGLLSIGELRDINAAEAALNAGASVSDFDQQFQNLENELLSLESQLNGFGNALDLGLLGAVTSSLLGSLGDFSNGDIDDMRTITIGEGDNARTIRVANNRTLAELLYGSNGLDQDPDMLNDEDYFLRAGIDDLVDFLPSVAENTVGSNAAAVVALQLMIASGRNASKETQERQSDKNGNEIIDASAPMPIMMSGFTTSASALFGLTQQLTGMVTSNVSSFVGDEDNPGLLSFDIQSINVNGEDLQIRVPTGDLAKMIFMPQAVESLDPNDPSDAAKIRAINQFAMQNGFVNQLNIPVQEFNNFLANNQNAIASEIQTIIASHVLSNPALIEAKNKFSQAKQRFENFKAQIAPITSAIDSKTTALNDKDVQKASLEAALAQLSADPNADPAQITQLQTDIAAADAEITTLNAELTALNDQLAQLDAQKAQIQQELQNEVTNYSNILTQLTESSEAEIVDEVVNDEISEALGDTASQLEEAKGSLSTFITDPESGLISQLEDLINGQLAPDFGSVDQQMDMRRLIALIFIFSMLAQSEWDEQQAEVDYSNF